MIRLRSRYFDMNPKIAVVGTCQIGGIGLVLEKLLPGTTVNKWQIDAPESPEAIAEHLTGYDFVFSQAAGSQFPILDAEKLQAKNGRVVLLPPVVFSGLQPDCIYLLESGSPLESPFGPYHSAIAVAGFLLGLSPTHTFRLYNAFVQERLGYLRAFGDAETALINSFAAVGVDLTTHVRQWLNEGPFMHTPNHPAIRVSSTITTLAARLSGLIGDGVASPGDVPDPLLNHPIWPIYPAIARHLGITGSMTFLRPIKHQMPHSDRSIAMDRFVAECHALYRTLPRETLETPYVAGVCHLLSKL